MCSGSLRLHNFRSHKGWIDIRWCLLFVVKDIIWIVDCIKWQYKMHSFTNHHRVFLPILLDRSRRIRSLDRRMRRSNKGLTHTRQCPLWIKNIIPLKITRTLKELLEPSQCVSIHPLSQLHVYMLMSSVQFPFTHGLDKHSSVSTVQNINLRRT